MNVDNQWSSYKRTMNDCSETRKLDFYAGCVSTLTSVVIAMDKAFEDKHQMQVLILLMCREIERVKTTIYCAGNESSKKNVSPHEHSISPKSVNSPTE